MVRSPPLKPTKVTFFTIILYNSGNNIRDIRSFFRPLFCHESVVKYTSSLLQCRSRYETWLPDITEISHPLTLLARSAPAMPRSGAGYVTAIHKHGVETASLTPKVHSDSEAFYWMHTSWTMTDNQIRKRRIHCRSKQNRGRTQSYAVTKSRYHCLVGSEESRSSHIDPFLLFLFMRLTVYYLIISFLLFPVRSPG